MDPLAGMAVSLMIMKTAIDMGWESIRELSDETVDDNQLKELIDVIKIVPGVRSFHNLRARRMGHYTLVDLVRS